MAEPAVTRMNAQRLDQWARATEGVLMIFHSRSRIAHARSWSRLEGRDYNHPEKSDVIVLNGRNRMQSTADERRLYYFWMTPVQKTLALCQK